MTLPSVLDERGTTVSVAGDLLCFVEHAFTAEAEAALRRASAAHATGKNCRVVSVDSAAALGAWVAAVGVRVPVGSDPSGVLARALSRFNEETCAFHPGWGRIGEDGEFTLEDPPEPSNLRRALPGWVYYALAAVLAVAAGWTYLRHPPTEAPPAAPPAVSTGSGTVPVAETLAPPPKKVRPSGGAARGVVGGGWYAVPPALAGKQVRFVDGVLEVEGADLPKPPMACLTETPAMTGAVRVSGNWSLDHVGTAASKGGRIGLRLLDVAGRLLPQGVVPGGAQVWIANGRLMADWAPFNKLVPRAEAAVSVRLCVDNLAGSGVVRVRDVVLSVE